MLAAASVAVIRIGFTRSPTSSPRAPETQLIDRLAATVPAYRSSPPALPGSTHVVYREADRVAVADPPWLDTHFDRLGPEYFLPQGFEVVSQPQGQLMRR